MAKQNPILKKGGVEIYIGFIPLRIGTTGGC
jgi:hypothetical protein